MTLVAICLLPCFFQVVFFAQFLIVKKIAADVACSRGPFAVAELPVNVVRAFFTLYINLVVI